MAAPDPPGRPGLRMLAQISVVATLVSLTTVGASAGVCSGASSVDTAQSDSVHPKRESPAASQSPTRSSPADRRAGCPFPTSGFDCAQQRRFAATQRYLATRPGITAVVVTDRHTGATWKNQHAATPIWTASTIKLATVVDLHLRDLEGSVMLSAEDRRLMFQMVVSSDDNAADRLWSRYNGAAAADRYSNYGMVKLSFPRVRHWGSAKSTAEDHDRLMRYVLSDLPPELRNPLVTQMRSVAANQRWGVWGAGAAARPGNKNGWWGYGSGWVINSFGFVGPGERFTVTLLNDLQGAGGYSAGVQTTTRAAALLFTGAF